MSTPYGVDVDSLQRRFAPLTLVSSTPTPEVDLTQSSPLARSERTPPSLGHLLIAGALSLAVLRSLGLAQDHLKRRRVGSQSGNYPGWQGVSLGQGHPIGWYLDRANPIRKLIIAQTAAELGNLLPQPLGKLAEMGIDAALLTATDPASYRSTQSQALARQSRLISGKWAAQYTKQLGEGLGDKSADGLLISLGELQKANMREDLAWKIVHNIAGLPQGQALSVTQVAIQRVQTALSRRRPVTPLDLAQDAAKIALSQRAKRIAENESQVAINFGAQILLMNAERHGYLPKDAKKVWVTAVDERVCPVCAPMDSVAVRIEEPFTVHPHLGVLSKEVRIWVPPAHPNCRCRIVTDKAIEHGIITRTARFSRDPNSRARLRSRLADITQEGPAWAEDVAKFDPNQFRDKAGRWAKTAGYAAVAGIGGATVLVGVVGGRRLFRAVPASEELLGTATRMAERARPEPTTPGPYNVRRGGPREVESPHQHANLPRGHHMKERVENTALPDPEMDSPGLIEGMLASTDDELRANIAAMMDYHSGKMSLSYETWGNYLMGNYASFPDYLQLALYKDIRALKRNPAWHRRVLLYKRMRELVDPAEVPEMWRGMSTQTPHRIGDIIDFGEAASFSTMEDEAANFAEASQWSMDVLDEMGNVINTHVALYRVPAGEARLLPAGNRGEGEWLGHGRMEIVNISYEEVPLPGRMKAKGKNKVRMTVYTLKRPEGVAKLWTPR